MKAHKIMVIAVVALAILTAGLAACKKGSDGKTSKVSTDIVALSKMFHMPFTPKAVWWQTTALSDPDVIGPTDYILAAVILFDKNDIEEIMKHATPVQPVNMTADEIFLKVTGVRLFLGAHGALEETVYSGRLFKPDASMVRIKGTNKLFVFYEIH